MNHVDIIILVSVILIAMLIVFFQFKKRKNGCHGCEYVKKCDSYCEKIEK